MKYLPIYPEKSWGETVLPPDYRGSGREDGLPLTDSLITSMVSLPSNYPETLYPRSMGMVSMPFVMLADGMGQFGNTTYNGYKRLYNYGANAYNNLADKYNNWKMQKYAAAPQTTLTGRKITYDMNPGLYNASIAIAEKPKAYFVKNGQILGEVRREYPYVSRVVQQPNQLEVPVEEAKNYYAMAPVDESANLKRTIAKGLASMVNNGKLNNGDLSRTQKLINLYNKIK